MENHPLKKCAYFIGIDISKMTLDVTLQYNNSFVFHKVIENEVDSIKTLLKDLRKIKGFKIKCAVFGMEHTGIYCNHIKTELIKAKANFTMENPLHIKHSLGLRRGKNDKIDSRMIAEHVFKTRFTLKLWRCKRSIIDQLASLSSLRNRLMSTASTLKTPLNEDAKFQLKSTNDQNFKLCSKSIAALESDIVEVNMFIKNLWSSDDEIKRLMTLITSIPSVGEGTALQVIITTNEFKDITDPRSFACYAGVAPFPYKSGTTISRRTEVSHIANKKIKSLMHLCALTSLRSLPEMKAYYERKTKVEGKSKMSVINAIRFKLICRIFACVNQNRKFEKDYAPRLVSV